MRPEILIWTNGGIMVLETNRLFLRPWKLEDVERLYELARNPHVGPPCGWMPHENLEESGDVLRDILINGFTYAICLKENAQVIGNIALMPYAESRYAQQKNQSEIGFWLGYPYWGKGYMTEACQRLLQYGFEVQRLDTIWAAHNLDNIASMRVQQKCGFVFHHEDIQCVKKTDQRICLKVNYIKRKDKRD